jgi:hypothetical protein
MFKNDRWPDVDNRTKEFTIYEVEACKTKDFIEDNKSVTPNVSSKRCHLWASSKLVALI